MSGLSKERAIESVKTGVNRGKIITRAATIEGAPSQMKIRIEVDLSKFGLMKNAPQIAATN